MQPDGVDANLDGVIEGESRVTDVVPLLPVKAAEGVDAVVSQLQAQGLPAADRGR